MWIAYKDREAKRVQFLLYALMGANGYIISVIQDVWYVPIFGLSLVAALLGFYVWHLQDYIYTHHENEGKKMDWRDVKDLYNKVLGLIICSLSLVFIGASIHLKSIMIFVWMVLGLSYMGCIYKKYDPHR